MLGGADGRSCSAERLWGEEVQAERTTDKKHCWCFTAWCPLAGSLLKDLSLEELHL